MKWALVTLLLAQTLASCQTSRVRLIEQFLHRRSITTLVLLHCFREPVDVDVVRISKSLRESYHGSIYNIDMNKANFERQMGWHMYCERYKTGVVVNLECSRIETVLGQLSSGNYFNASFHWLMFGGRNFQRTTYMLSEQNINYDTSITMVFPIDGDSPDERYEVYDVSGTVKRRGGRIHFSLLGMSTASGLLPASVASKPDLKGIELWTAVTILPHHEHTTFIEKLDDLTKPKAYSSVRHSYKLVKLLQMKLNFRMKIIVTDDWRFDLIGHNSTRGLTGQLQSKVIDFAITPFAIQGERIPICDFTIEIARATFYTVFRHPKSLNNHNIFLLPFATGLWAAIVVMFFLVTTMLAVSTLWANRREPSRRSYCDAILIFKRCFLETLGMLCQQGLHQGLTYANRTVTLITMGFSLLLLQYYSSFIVGYQLVSPPKTINTLEKLLESNVRMSVEDLSYQHDFFERTKNPYALQLYEKKILPSMYGFVNSSVGVQLVKGGGYAYHSETSYTNTLYLEVLSEREICELQQVELYPQRPVHTVLIKGSPLRELFKVNLQLVKESGLMTYYATRNYIPRPKCIKSSNHVEQIYFTDVRFAFVLLATGMVASVAMLLGERITERVHRWYQYHMMPVPENFVWLN